MPLSYRPHPPRFHPVNEAGNRQIDCFRADRGRQGPSHFITRRFSELHLTIKPQKVSSLNSVNVNKFIHGGVIPVDLKISTATALVTRTDSRPERTSSMPISQRDRLTASAAFRAKTATSICRSRFAVCSAACLLTFPVPCSFQTRLSHSHGYRNCRARHGS